MKASFENSVNVLVKAYLNNELHHGWPCGCAVGNLVADAYKTKPSVEFPQKFENGMESRWGWLCHYGRVLDVLPNDEYKEDYVKAREQVSNTGYTLEQIAQIERAFEKVVGYTDRDDKMFKSLMAVVDTLAEIHNVDLSIKEEAKEMFVKC